MINNNNKTINLDVLNNHPIFKHLNNKQKEILLELINDKETKLEHTARPLDYTAGITIKNKNHHLVIITRTQGSDWKILKPNKAKKNDYFIHNYPNVLLQNQKEHHEIRFNEEYKIIIDQTGNFNYIRLVPSHFEEQFDDEIFNLSYEFYLDGNLIIIKNYNADLGYFLKNTKDYNLESIYNFFSKDLEEFNKSNYEIMQLFGLQDEFHTIDAYYNFFNEELDEYLQTPDRLERECYLSAIYFKEICIPKLQNLLKYNLDNLAKIGFKYDLIINEDTDQEQLEPTGDLDKWDPDALENWVDYRFFKYKIQKSNKQITFENYEPDDVLFDGYFDFDFYGLSYEGGKDFDEIKEELDALVIKVANKLNTNLQPNILVAYHKILKQLNYTNHNLHLDDIKNSNETYVARRLQYSYGYLKNTTGDSARFDNDYIYLWRYNNDILSFERFGVNRLCVLLAKNNSLNDIALKNQISFPKSFNNLNYEINNKNEIGFYFEIKLEDDEVAKLSLKQKDNKNNAWQNQKIKKIKNLTSYYTKYFQYAKSIYKKDSNTLEFSFHIPLNKNLDINTILHNIYDEFKDKIILKEEVQEKVQKANKIKK